MATITFSCPACRKAFQVAAETGGMQAKCPCGAAISIPAATAPAKSPPLAATVQPAQQPPAPKLGAAKLGTASVPVVPLASDPETVERPLLARLLWVFGGLMGTGLLLLLAVWLFSGVSQAPIAQQPGGSTGGNAVDEPAEPAKAPRKISNPEAWRKVSETLALKDIKHPFSPSAGCYVLPFLSEDRRRVTLFNLETKETRTVDCSQADGQVYDVQVNPRGDLLALLADKAPEQTKYSNRGPVPTSIEIWSVETQRKVAALPSEGKRWWTLFLDNLRLLSPNDVSTEIWNIEEQTVIERWPVVSGALNSGSMHDARQVAVTPDGRFLAELQGRRSIAIRDTRDKGRYLVNFNIQEHDEPINYHRWPSHFMAFSPDGKELAFHRLWREEGNSELTVWDWARGQKLDFVRETFTPSPREVRRQGGLQWLPDRRGWLLSDEVMVGRIGRPLEDKEWIVGAGRKPVRIQPHRNYYDVTSYVLPDGRVADLVASESRTDIEYRKLPLPETPAPEIAEPETAGPATTEPAITKKLELVPDAAPADHWTIAPGLVLKEIPDHLRIHLAKQGPFGVLTRTTQAAGQAFVDLRTGKTTPFHVRADARLETIAGDGAWVALRGDPSGIAQAARRDADTQKLIAAIERTFYLVNTSTGEMQLETHATTGSAPFCLLPGGRFALQSNAPGYQVFEIPSGKLLASVPSAHGMISGIPIAAQSDTGRYLANYSLDGWIEIFDLKEYRNCGSFRIELPPKAQMHELAYNQDGTKLACRIRTDDARAGLMILDLATGKAGPLKSHLEREMMVHDNVRWISGARWQWPASVLADDGTWLGRLVDPMKGDRVLGVFGDQMLLRKRQNNNAPYTLYAAPVPETLLPPVPVKR